VLNLGHARYARRFAQHVVPHVLRPARVIWNQAIGGIFALFALVFLGNGLRYYRDADPNPVAVIFSVFLGLVMAFFGIASFLKARRISRS
jgi:hypothetical protein